MTKDLNLEPCPFCAQPLEVVRRRFNPYARCVTEGCTGSKLPLLNLDVPGDIDAWNTRRAAHPPALGGEPIEPRYFYAECADPDYSCLCNNHGDALTAIADHGGTVTKLWNIDPNAHVARLQAEVERLNALHDVDTEAMRRMLARNAELEGLLRKQAEHIATLANNTLSYSSGIGSLLKTKEVNDAAYAALAHQQVVNAALAGGKEHE